MSDRDLLIRLLERARWAPSGDNTQPWRFEIAGERHVVVHGFDTRDEVIYDFRGHASQMAHGALLETLRLAAAAEGWRAGWQLRPDSDDRSPVYDVAFEPEPGLQAESLERCIESRVVQRRPMRMRALADDERRALAAAVGEDFELQFFESLRDRARVAGLLWANARIRLTCPEAFEVHRSVIEWGARFSEDRIPDQAVGVDPLTARLMRFVMQSWSRVEFFNRYLMGTVAPRVQLDLLPALACSAHVLLKPRHRPAGLADRVRAGVAMQRLWLAAAELGLHLQPEMTPVIFRWYAREGERISRLPEIDRAAHALAERFEALCGARPDEPFAFFCRIGESATPRARSTRKPLASLMREA